MLELLLARLRVLENELTLLEGRVSKLEGEADVLTERTCEHENRLEELEEWQIKVDDIIENY
jgi:predicted nuclease with TOPRIM domain